MGMCTAFGMIIKSVDCHGWYFETSYDPDDVKEAKLHTWGSLYTALNDLVSDGWVIVCWVPGNGMLMKRDNTSDNEQ